jgi:hypothetical protein
MHLMCPKMRSYPPVLFAINLIGFFMEIAQLWAKLLGPFFVMSTSWNTEFCNLGKRILRSSAKTLSIKTTSQHFPTGLQNTDFPCFYSQPPLPCSKSRSFCISGYETPPPGGGTPQHRKSFAAPSPENLGPAPQPLSEVSVCLCILHPAPFI